MSTKPNTYEMSLKTVRTIDKYEQSLFMLVLAFIDIKNSFFAN